MAHGKHGGAGIYVVVALILGVITFIEYYIVEFPPVWLSSGWVLFWLIALSLAKFWMVIWFFMHLKDDDRLYTGFFASGMVIALGTFVVMALMFLLPRAVAPVIAEAQAEVHADAHAEALPDEVRELIDSDGLSRGIAERADAPRPKDQSLEVVPPAAPEGGFALRDEEPVTAAVEEEPAVAEEPAVPEAVAEPEAEPEPAEDIAAEAPDPEFDRALGEQVYAQNCSACHQVTGQGIPGAFPPLAGHAPELYLVDGGRTLLIDILLYGLQGPITVSGQGYNGLMPAWPQLSDEQVAAVVNHILTAWGNDAAIDDFDAIRAAEVAAERDKGLSPGAVHELRTSLGLD